MNPASKYIFDGFPRTVASASDGRLHQHFVHSQSEFDQFFKSMRGERSLYSSICRFRSDMRHVLPNVPFDFDSPMKDSAFPNDMHGSEKYRIMLEDDDKAHEVLGEVWDDVCSLVSLCQEKGVPVISVFSGMGVHCHVLFQERVEPVKEKISISNWLIDEADLGTYDRQIVTDTRRVLRVPNSHRFDAGEPTGIWCIPLTEKEVLQNTLEELLERCSSPKSIPEKDRYEHQNRPEMQVVEGYEESEEDYRGIVDIDGDIDDVPEMAEWIVRNCIDTPCVAERFLGSNPHHMVRFNGVVSLYQSGFKPDEVRDIIRKMNWIDYDEGITRKMTDQIWNRKYSENKCSTLQRLGLCVQSPEFENHGDEPKDCETYGYTSGKARY